MLFWQILYLTSTSVKSEIPYRVKIRKIKIKEFLAYLSLDWQKIVEFFIHIMPSEHFSQFSQHHHLWILPIVYHYFKDLNIKKGIFWCRGALGKRDQNKIINSYPSSSLISWPLALAWRYWEYWFMDSTNSVKEFIFWSFENSSMNFIKNFLRSFSLYSYANNIIRHLYFQILRKRSIKTHNKKVKKVKKWGEHLESKRL